MALPLSVGRMVRFTLSFGVFSAALFVLFKLSLGRDEFEPCLLGPLKGRSYAEVVSAGLCPLLLLCRVCRPVIGRPWGREGHEGVAQGYELWAKGVGKELGIDSDRERT